MSRVSLTWQCALPRADTLPRQQRVLRAVMSAACALPPHWTLVRRCSHPLPWLVVSAELCLQSVRGSARVRCMSSWTGLGSPCSAPSTLLPSVCSAVLLCEDPQSGGQKPLSWPSVGTEHGLQCARERQALRCVSISGGFGSPCCASPTLVPLVCTALAASAGP